MKKVLSLVLVAVMVFALAACGASGPDVAGTYKLVGESYTGEEFFEASSEASVILENGGKGKYNNSYEFDLEWTLEEDKFTGTVTLLGLEEKMEGILKDGVLQVQYGESAHFIFLLDGKELPADIELKSYN